MDPKEITNILDDPERFSGLGDTYAGLPAKEKKELVEALKDVRDERAGKALAAIYRLETDREMLKLIKKHLFRLKTMGLKVEDPVTPGEPVLKTIEEKRHHMGFMSNYDLEKIRVVVAAFEVKRNYYIFINAEIHFADGLIDLRLAPLSKQGLEEIIGEYREGTSGNHVFIEIPPQYAAGLIEESDSASHRYADDVKQVRLFADTLKGNVRKPDDIYSLEVPDGTETLPVSVVLSDEIFQPFFIGWDTIEEDRKALESLTDPAILLPPHMIEEKMESFLKALLDRETLKPQIPRLRRLLEDYAYIFYLSGSFDRFMTLRDLLNDEKGLEAAFAFFVGQALQKKKPNPDNPPGLIVNPHGQVRR